MAASGSAQIAYQGSSQAVQSSSAIVAQPAIVRQSAPFQAPHRVNASAARKAAVNRSRHQPGSPAMPSQRAVSCGML